MLTHFSIILMLSGNLHAENIKAKISDETVAFFKNNSSSCSGFSRNSTLGPNFIKAIKEGIQNNGLNSYIYQERKLFLKSYGCTDDFIKNFSKALGSENIEYHAQQRSLLLKEMAEYEKRGLLGTTVLSEYTQYAEKNDVDLPTDPEMDEVLKKKQGKIQKRKEACSPVMNLKKPLSLDEPRNQQGIGWCYAYTAADLISNELGEKVSAAYSASAYNKLLLSRIFRSKEGGYIDDAANAVLDRGVCLEKDVRSDDYEFIDRQNDIKTLLTSVNELGAIYSEKKEIPSMSDKKPATTKSTYTKWQVYVDLCTQQTNTLIQLSQVFPNLTLDQLTNVLMKSGDGSFEDLIRNCPVNKSVELKGVKFNSIYDLKNTSKLMAKLDETLTKGNIAGIAYKADALENFKKENMDRYHASSIVGRRFNEKTMSCEYLLRNSWGKDCSSYASNIECRKGHAWIGEEVLTYNNSIYGVTYVEKK